MHVLLCHWMGLDVVSDDDHLPLGFGFTKQSHKFVEDRLGIEVLFRLIYNQRAVVGVVQREI